MVIELISRRRPYNAASEFVDANIARGFAQKIAFIDPDRAMSYAELRDRIYQFGAALRRLGLRQENRIILLSDDTVDFPVVFWGAINAGVIVIPLNTMMTVEQYAYVIEDSRASAVVVAAPIAQTIAPALNREAAGRILILVGAKEDEQAAFRGQQVHHLEDILAREEAEPRTASTISDEVAFWLYTSGSTGKFKGVKHLHSSLMAAARLFGQRILGIRQDDLVYSAAKLASAYGLGNAMSLPMSVGATSVLLPGRPDPASVFEVMRCHRPSVFYAWPTLYAAMLSHKDVGHKCGSNRLRICLSAGEALPEHLGRRWRDLVGVDILDGFGSTELLQTFVSNRPDDVRYGSTGKPVPGYDVKIVDDCGHEVVNGKMGELIVRGPSAGEGYWNQRALTRRTFAGEWTRTGDLFVCDGDGYYRYRGRTDDMFKVDGMWVSPLDVEAALLSHEAVREAAVVGKEDADGLMKPKAFVVLNEGYVANEQLLEQLKGHVRERAGSWTSPCWIEFRRELPKTATGKVQRFKLRNEGTARRPN